MTKENFQQYADLENQVKELKEKQESIKSNIMQEMETENTDKVQVDLIGTFSITKRVTYKFTPEVEQKIADGKTVIKKIEMEGRETAEAIESESLRFQAKK